MACMKCGKETREGQLFCARCLETMEAYPVKPDAHIQLPVRKAGAAPKKQLRKRTEKAAAVAALRMQVRLLWAVIIALLLCIAILLFRGFWKF